jgi:enediyne biosynthesis protein E4
VHDSRCCNELKTLFKLEHHWLRTRAAAVWILCLPLTAVVPGRLGAEQFPQWHVEPGFHWTSLDVPRSGKTGFTLLAPEQTGVNFTNTLAEEEGVANRVLWNGSGVALGDYDNDGRPDIFLCGLDTPNALYRNLGNWKFTNVTRQAGLECAGKYFRGAVFADLNGDGWLDLLVSTVGQGVLCYQNDGQGHFTDVTAIAGTASHFGSTTMALADIDGNGTLDLYIANNRTTDIRDNSGQVGLYMRNGQLVVPPQLADRLMIRQGRVMEFGEPDQLLLNDGQGRFSPVSWTNGVFLDEEGVPLKTAPLDWGLTATFRDINGDGAPDLYVCNDFWTPDRIWINNGHGQFRAIPTLAIRHTSASSMGIDFADINRDGELDFYVLDMLSRDHRLRRRQMLSPQRPAMSGVGEIDTRPQIMSNTLFLNRGDTTFAEIGDYAGVEASDWSWSPIFIDVDLDGYEDLLISAGHARDVQDLDANAQVQARQRSYLAIANPAERQQAFMRDKMVNARLYPRLAMPVVALRNLGNLHFQEVTSGWGTDSPGVHQGMAMADLDNDGDLDLVVNNLGSPAGIYRNDTSAPRVAVRLKGLPPNNQGIGAKVKLLNGAVPMQSQEMICGGRYLSGSDPMLVFAAGGATQGMSLEVLWRRGRRTQIQDVRPNRLYEIDEAGSVVSSQSSVVRGQSSEAVRHVVGASHETSTTASPGTSDHKEAATDHAQLTTDHGPLFRDVSEVIGHTHTDEPFNDFGLQPSLPKRLSQPGPGVAWGDLNGDGHEDLVIGSGKGGTMAVYLGDGKGRFQRETSAPFNKPVARDQTGMVILQQAPSGAVILSGTSCYEDGGAPGPPIARYDWQRRGVDEPLPVDPSSTGPIALADIDGDGDLDLFVGGRVIAGRWPEAASSRIYRNNAGQWTLDVPNTKALEKVGMVSGAVFTDLDGDGWPDLLLACEWGPIRLFRNKGGSFHEETAEWGLAQFTGWWNGVAVGDFDGDGKLDIVASNWGLNSPYHATAQHPVRIYYGDLSDRGSVDLLEASFDPELRDWGPMWIRDVVANSLVWIADKYPTHRAYSEASAESILGEHLGRASLLQANTLSSMVFLNRGGHFEPIELPPEAQFAPAYAVTVADFDGDGFEDVFLSQNFFGTEAQVPRLDAGRGLLLRGNGTGKLIAVPGQESGLLIYGEQRGAAVSDFNEDGRADLVVTQNGAATRLFVNVGAKPGLRVRLQGPLSNPTAVGATVRLRFGERLGPAREVHAGSGYYSQDSPVLVLGTPQPPTGIVVRWPGGATTERPIPSGAKAITLEYALEPRKSTE